MTTASLLDIATSLFADPDDGLRWLVEHAPRAGAAAPSQDVRARALDLADPGRRTLAAVPGGDRVLATWAQRRVALTAYRAALVNIGADPELLLPDLLHLHHARAAGPSLDAERTCLRLARAAALSQLARGGQAA